MPNVLLSVPNDDPRDEVVPPVDVSAGLNKPAVYTRCGRAVRRLAEFGTANLRVVFLPGIKSFLLCYPTLQHARTHAHKHMDECTCSLKNIYLTQYVGNMKLALRRVGYVYLIHQSGNIQMYNALATEI